LKDKRRRQTGGRWTYPFEKCGVADDFDPCPVKICFMHRARVRNKDDCAAEPFEESVTEELETTE
jgi:hypothetical protein